MVLTLTIKLGVFICLAIITWAIISRLSYYNAAFTGIAAGVIDFMLAEIIGSLIAYRVKRRALES